MTASICPLRTRRLSLSMAVRLWPSTTQGSLNSDSLSYQGICAAVSTWDQRTLTGSEAARVRWCDG